jgi:hypothetical protein
MAAITNRLNDLFGVDTSDQAAAAVGIGTSPLNPAYMRINRYNNGLFTHFNDGATIPAGWTLSNTGAVSAATYGTLAGGVGSSATPTSGGAFTSGGNEHVMLSSIAGTDAVVAKGAGVFVTDTYYTYRIEVDYAGTAKGYVNGALLGTKTGLTTTAPLCAYATASPRTTSERVLTIDYIGIAGL